MHEMNSIQWLMLVIMALTSIIPAGIVFLSIRSRQFAQDHRIDASFTGKEAVDSCIKQQNDTIMRIDRLDAQIIQLEESLRAFNNRMSVRERHEKKRIEEEERAETTQRLPEIDEQQIRQLNFPQPQSTEQPRLILKKKAG
jgi:TolA-binding protein